MISAISGWRQQARRLRNRISPGGLILLYHRVADVTSDFWSLCVSPRNFAEQMEVLQNLGIAVSLQQLNQTLEAGKRPQQQVVVTFDDGYADNLYNAKPILERYRIPATIFLTTGYMVQEREFWTDELDRLLLQPGKLPEVLSLKIQGTNYEWELGAASNYSEQDAQRYRHLNYLSLHIPSIRHSLYYSLYQLLYPLPARERWHLIEEIRIWAGVEIAVRSTHRTLTPEEISALAAGELIEIGAHTVFHPFLSTLSTDAQWLEITHSQAVLEDILGLPVVTFAYPHGNFTEETKAIVQEVGFRCACSTVPKSVGKHSDRFALPRVVVEDCNGEEFARRLFEWFEN